MLIVYVNKLYTQTSCIIHVVQVGGDANYPACRILSYKDFVTAQRVKAKDLRRKMLAQRRVQEIKEVRVSPVIAEHDLSMKLATVERFLAKGNKVCWLCAVKTWCHHVCDLCPR